MAGEKHETFLLENVVANKIYLIRDKTNNVRQRFSRII